MRRLLFISALLLFLCVSSFGMAFDNHRQGFIIGGLGGIALDTWNVLEEVDDYERKVDHGDKISLHVDFRIGGGFKGDKFMLYEWFVVDLLVGETYDYDYKEYSYLTIIFFGGPGVSYYFKPTSPSLYINAGIGIAMWSAPTSHQPGVGAMGGIGYEFTRHFSVEFGVMWCKGMIALMDPSNVDSLAISLSIIAIDY